MASSREFALYFFVSLFSCFDHFIGVFDYSVGRSMFKRDLGLELEGLTDIQLMAKEIDPSMRKKA